MNHIKGASARRIFQRVPDLKVDAGVNSFWQTRYGFKVIEPGAVPTVRKYIQTQWDRLEGYDR
jgi:REP element-mobilizing transposase RayT